MMRNVSTATAAFVVLAGGGGACFSAETCDPENDLYRTAVTHGPNPDDPALDEIFATWGAGDVLPAWFDPAGLSAPGLFAQSGRHDPDFAEDEHQASWYPDLGVPAGDLRARLEANEELIEAAGVGVHSYVVPDEEVAGHPLVDWMTKLIAGEPVDDVR